jgi:CDP-diacylglycerol--glycerol-3-phosphate 3-phosphatidyltransferase
MIYTIPNILSLARLLVFLPILWLLALHGQPVWLGVVLAGALFTDVLDGRLARRLNQVTALGSRLDSIADNTLLVSAVVWLLMLRPEVIHGRHGMVLALSVALWAASIIIGWVRFHRFANLHLYSDKTAAVIGGIFLVASFMFGFHSWMFYLAAGMSALANIEGIVLLITRDEVDEHMGSIFCTAGQSDDTHGSRVTAL